MAQEEAASAYEAPGRSAPEQGSGLRGRLSRITGRGGGGHPELEPLIRTLKSYHPRSDVKLVERAYEVAAELHAPQKRRSGEPYITHPLAVATILADLGMTDTTLAAALLHDTVEDTGYTIAALEADFGPEIAGIVDGVTKLDKVTYGQSSGAETVRKMVVAMARDIRVLVVKLCDRLHNMRTLEWLPPEKREVKARETLEIYAPLAHRLGMNTVKWELEDLSFANLYPKMYEEIVRLVTSSAPAREEYLNSVIETIEDDLRVARVRATVTGRPKHYYSVYQKMVVRSRDFTEIYDLVGVRVLVDTVRDCYAVLGALHARWNPVPGRFKDYIAMPKFAVYQSLHTTVIGPEGTPVEVQIRTHDMDRAAEYGVAAHWRYKQSDVGGKRSPSDLAWLRQLVEWQRESEDPEEFLDSLRYDLGGNEVFVFTPKGDVISLPAGGTPVDFAYAVHTEVGHRTVGARVNGKLVPLESGLNNGDVIEVFTSKAEGQGPSRDWLTFVKSPRARNKIRAWFSKERREEAIEHGKEAILKAMRRQGLPLQRLMNHAALQSLAAELRQPDVSALYAAVGEGRISATSIVDRLVATAGGEQEAIDVAAEGFVPESRAARSRPVGDPGVTVIGAHDVLIKLARCCTPVPGDEITGFVTRGQGVSVHRKDCSNVSSLSGHADRMVPVAWSPTSTSLFMVNIQVEALDRNRLLADVTRALSDQHVNILSASVSTTKDRIALSKFTFQMADPKHLDSLLRAVRQVEGVYDAYRV